MGHAMGILGRSLLLISHHKSI